MSSIKIDDLRKHLANTIENLQNCDPDKLEDEIKRSKAIGTIATVMVESAKVEVAFFQSLPTEVKHHTEPNFFKSPDGIKIIPAGE